MVLQRQQPVPVWGHANPGEKVQVSFADQVQQTVADDNGRWRVALAPMSASAESRSLAVVGENTVTFQDVLVGEVWFCSGQSNMEMAVGIKTAGARPEITHDPVLVEQLKTDHFPTLRLFRVQKKIEGDDVVTDGWTPAEGEARDWFSAIGYVFGRELHRRLDVPVGMLQATWGGSRIETWTPADAYRDNPAFASQAVGDTFQIDGFTPGRNYEGMVHPLAPYALRGVLWYQGETQVIDLIEDSLYPEKYATLTGAWRKAWAQPDLPFYSVQIAPYLYSARKGKHPIPPDALPRFWQMQLDALKIPHTGMVPCADLVDNVHEIHPGGKRAVAERLINLVSQEIYGQMQDEDPQFPRVSNCVADGEKLVLHFAHVGRGLTSLTDKPLSVFEVVSSNGDFEPAREAKVQGDTVTLITDKPGQIAQVRYGWTEDFRPGLGSSAGLPVWPFVIRVGQRPATDNQP